MLHTSKPPNRCTHTVCRPAILCLSQEDLFRQALESSLDRYQAILASLQLAPAAQRGVPPRLPLRLYLRTDAGGGRPRGGVGVVEGVLRA